MNTSSLAQVYSTGRELSFFTGGGAVWLWGGQNFSGWYKGPAKIFCRVKEGGKNFFLGPEGGCQNFLLRLWHDFL